MPVRSAKAEWRGNLREGNGTASFGNFEGAYSFPSRFEEGEGTNPEEMMGAAFAACYAMALAGNLGAAGFAPDEIRSEAKVHVEKGAAGFSITRIDPTVEARAQGIDEGAFQEQAEKTKTTCPVSKALAVKDVRLKAKLL
ncbi:MAG: OsmC family peroxiredoxin [Trueperaceae bacterium]